MAKSNIEWTESTWNPVTGCSKISSGCKHCYAENLAKVFQKRGFEQYKNGFEVTLAHDKLSLPLKWKEPRIIFVNSMSDLFHEDIPLEYLKKIFFTMNQTPQHTYQVLTKRSDRLKSIARQLDWTNNIWMGVSIESPVQLHRLDDLREVPAVVRFVSFEPLLNLIEAPNLYNIDWIIVGGESGPKARKIDKQWVTQLMDDAKIHKVAFFFKQWGKPSFNPDPNDPTISPTHQNYARGGCLIDGKVYREFPVSPS